MKGYLALAKFDVRQWLLHLLVRANWRALQQWEDLCEAAGEPPIGIMPEDELARCMRENPNGAYPVDLLKKNASKLGAFDFGPVRSMSVRDLASIALQAEVAVVLAHPEIDPLFNDQEALFKGLWRTQSPELKATLSLPLHAVIDRQYPVLDVGAFCQVDLNAPEDALVDAFRDWARTTRLQLAGSERVKSFSPADLHRWVEMRVLQYIDLINWNIWKGSKITDTQAGAILFPEYVSSGEISGGERIRKTVRPLADRLLDWTRVVHPLAHQARHERSAADR